VILHTNQKTHYICLYNRQEQTDATEPATEMQYVAVDSYQKCCEESFKGQYLKGRDTCSLHIKSTDLKTCQIQRLVRAAVLYTSCEDLVYN